MESMLSFEISAMDVVLLVAMLVLLLLFVTQKRSQSVAKPELNVDDRDTFLGEPKTKGEIATETPREKQSAGGFQKCVHQFGYLKDMPKNTPIPDECFGCPKVLRCMFPNE